MVVPEDIKFRLGAIYPDDVWVDVEARALVEEFERFLPPQVELISAATYIPSLDNTLPFAIELAANGDIEEAAWRLLRYGPACFAYYCTTISFARGLGGDLDISQRISRRTGKPATTTSTAMIMALKELGITRLSVASPYLPDVEEALVRFLEAHGFQVVGRQSLVLKQGHSNVPPDQIRTLAELSDAPEAEAIFVACTGQKLAQHIEGMEARLGKPVLTANQVTTWHALRMMGIETILASRGRLFSRSSTVHVR